MNKKSVAVNFSTYNFLRLYCSIITFKEGNPIIDNHELEKALCTLIKHSNICENIRPIKTIFSGSTPNLL